MAKSAISHQAEFLDRITMREPGGQPWALIQPAICRTSRMALAHDHSMTVPFSGWINKSAAERDSSQA
jgi:hypothetical protein